MPTLTINTNLPASSIPNDFLKTTANVVADSLGKPLSYVVVHISPGQLMSFGATDEPCAIANLYSIGCLSPKENKKHSAALFEHIEKVLGIKGNRMYINYFDLPATNVGYSGKTFAG
ncbi:macrophage migration inhibitory factor homolog [Dermacentor silvarum]|uniref:macrophage migration inhibitory factor homolog n=1 Tax=Dermacentor silvarum TaxID=543639 RepID=UPI001897BE8B|nr:macrophage migration inhibitory factor homolog [Dermacentor silvarum]